MSFTSGIRCPDHDSDTCPCRTFKVSCSAFTAVEWGLTDQVQNRVDKNQSIVKLCDSAGYTMLHYASQQGHLDIVKLLIKEGAEVDACECGCTPLHRASYGGHLDCVIALVGSGADPFAKDTTDNGYLETPIHKASRQGRRNVVSWFLKTFPLVETAENSMHQSYKLVVESNSSVYEHHRSSADLFQGFEMPQFVGLRCDYCGEPHIRMTRMPCCAKLGCRKCFLYQSKQLLGCKLCREA